MNLHLVGAGELRMKRVVERRRANWPDAKPVPSHSARGRKRRAVRMKKKLQQMKDME